MTGIKNELAELLSGTRLLIGIGMPVALVLITLAGVLSDGYGAKGFVAWCTVGFWLLLVSAVTDVGDGYFARKWPPVKRWVWDNHKDANDKPNAAIFVLIPLVLTARFFVADVMNWSEEGHEWKTWIVWLALDIVFVIFTIRFNRDKERLDGFKAETAECIQGFLAAIIYLAMIFQVAFFAYGHNLWIYGGVIVGTLVLADLARKRWYERPESRPYPGATP